MYVKDMYNVGRDRSAGSGGDGAGTRSATGQLRNRKEKDNRGVDNEGGASGGVGSLSLGTEIAASAGVANEENINTLEVVDDLINTSLQLLDMIDSDMPVKLFMIKSDTTLTIGIITVVSTWAGLMLNAAHPEYFDSLF